MVLGKSLPASFLHPRGLSRMRLRTLASAVWTKSPAPVHKSRLEETPYRPPLHNEPHPLPPLFKQPAADVTKEPTAATRPLPTQPPLV